MNEDGQSCDITVFSVSIPNYEKIKTAKANSKCKIIFQYFEDEKFRSPQTLQTKTHLIDNQIIQFNKDTSKFVSINSSKGVMKIFIDINDKKVQSENKSEPNYYLLFFKDIEVKDEFQEFNFKIVNNIEVKLNIKVKNKFNSQKVGNLFQKFQPNQNKKEESSNPKSVIGTGVNMKERLAVFSKNKNENNAKENASKNVPKKLKIPSSFTSDNINKTKPNIEKKEEKKDTKQKGFRDENPDRISRRKGLSPPEVYKRLIIHQTG